MSLVLFSDPGHDDVLTLKVNFRDRWLAFVRDIIDSSEHFGVLSQGLACQIVALGITQKKMQRREQVQIKFAECGPRRSQAQISKDRTSKRLSF